MRNRGRIQFARRARGLFGGVMLVVLLGSATVLAQDQSGGRLAVGVLPFDDASGSGIPDANIAALGRLLRAELIRSGKLTPRMLALTPGTALPLEADQAAQLGQAAKVDLIVAPTVIKAESKSTQKGASSGRSVFGVQIGGAKATIVSAEVQIQVDLVRASDGQHLDTFTVVGKKSNSTVTTDAAGLSTTLGGADPSTPNFQGSPLGQALNEALTKLVGEVETRSPRALASAPPSTGVSAGQATGGGTPQSGGNMNASGGQAGSAGIVSSGGTSGNPPAGANSGGAGGQNSGSSSGNATSGSGGSVGNLSLPSFAADEINITGKKTKTSKIWASSNAMRVAGQDEKGKMGISIMRFDRKVIWVLVPDQNAYLEMAWGNLAQWASTLDGAQIERQTLGNEQVGAYHCEKARVKVTYQGKQYISIEWAAQELNGFVVKRQDEKGSWSTEYQNVQLGAQDPSLFEIPAGYKKLSMGGMFSRPNQ